MIANGRKYSLDGVPIWNDAEYGSSRHYTIVFTVFVVL